MVVKELCKRDLDEKLWSHEMNIGKHCKLPWLLRVGLGLCHSRHGQEKRIISSCKKAHFCGNMFFYLCQWWKKTIFAT